MRGELGALFGAVHTSASSERVFKYTDSFIASKELLWTEVGSEEAYRAMVSAFYMVFYEGTGCAKRLPAELLADDSFVWVVKHLRTSVQHDVEHGREGEVERKMARIEGLHLRACGKRYPRSIGDQRRIHTFLLLSACGFLVQLSR